MFDFQRPILTKSGFLEVICGCMFSGKTEALITQIRRAEIARLRFQVFKPTVDTRYANDAVASHNKNRFPAVNVSESAAILDLVEPLTEVVGIDEAQFFDPHIVNVAEHLANNGKRVIVAGLDTDWRGEPFGPMPLLMAKADVVRKQYAVCMVCGAPATKTQRMVASDDQFLLGSTDSYEARCRKHFDPELSLRMRKNSSRPTEESVSAPAHS
jgi:thymidine kinase